MLSFVVILLSGFLYANFIEWFIHKYLFHVLGSKKNSMWSFHWHRHHRTVRKQDYHDPDYLTSPFKDFKLWFNAVGKEVFGLLLLNIVHLCIFGLLLNWWLFYSVLGVYSVLYFVLHRASHIYPSWGKKWLPWHVKHHMGRNQQQWFNVVVPFWDYVFGTTKDSKK